MWIGRSKSRTDKVGNITWPNKPIKALGVYFGIQYEECSKLNWQSKLTECQSLIKNWLKRKLTMYGKVQIIKSLLIPKFTYLFHSLVVPESIVKEINTMIFKFLWDNKQEKVKRATLIGNKLQGGIDMLDLDSYITSLKLKWVKALTDESEANWKLIPKRLLKDFGDNFLIFYCNTDTIKSLNCSNVTEFYQELIKIWIKTRDLHKENQNLTFEQIRKQIIWGNRFIKIKNQCLFFKTWIKSNIYFLNDLLNDQGEVDQNVILNKLVDKRNCVVELNLLFKALPLAWKQTMKTFHSSQTKIKTEKRLKINNKPFELMDSKTIYQILVNKVFIKPATHSYWSNKYETKLNWNDIYKFITRLPDNRYKQFKFRVINMIFTSKETRYKWKMVSSPLCNKCNKIEDYQHLFIDCMAVNVFWEKILYIFQECGIQRNIRRLDILIFGYKISQEEYFYINVILTIVGFSIYKAYFCSNNWSNKFNILKLFKTEFEIIYQYFKYKKTKVNFFDKILQLLKDIY
ncbi:uncharacterized protein LOC132742114 [Ruditapes philippinarum]|uniref:uncharacterized protein LOC132742114 n=1 Tax=Ruditapes philippinarum TaxID=129788 RepID=UPI00295BE686|nr:uncharacterized protein LOC132742114 [Ruditapes philippinarum]